MFILCIYIILTSLIFSPVRAKPKTVKSIDINSEKLKSENSLPSSNINSIIEDNTGFIWIGTDAGLARFDGYRFKIYTVSPGDTGSISCNKIKNLFLDKEGTLWITTEFGFNKYIRRTDTFESYFLKDNIESDFDENFDNQMIFEDSRDLFWIPVFHEGLLVFDKSSEKFEKPGKYIYDGRLDRLRWANFVIEDSQNNLWFFTSLFYILKLDFKTGILSDYPNGYKHPKGFPRITGNLYIVDNDNILWEGFTSGYNGYFTKISLGSISEFSSDSVEFKRYKREQLGIKDTITSYVSSIIEDKNGMLWIGTNRGVSVMDVGKEIFYTVNFIPDNMNEISGKLIKAIFEDSKGMIWIASEHGLRIFNPESQKFPVFLYNDESENQNEFEPVTSIFEDKEGIYWLTSGSYLIKWDHNFEAIERIRPGSLGTRKFNKFLIDKFNNHWLICDIGNVLRKYDPLKNEISNIYKHQDAEGKKGKIFNDMIYDNESLLWLSSSDGLCSYDIKNNITKIYRQVVNIPGSLGNNKVNKVYADKSGNIWASTVTSLDKLDKQTGIFRHFKSSVSDSSGLSNIEVTSFYDDGQNHLWMTTYGGGLNMFDKNSERFIYITESDGFASNFMYDILPDDHGNLWISSNKGIAKFNPSDKVIRNYNTGDGLQGDEFGVVAYKSSSGQMFFGGNYGLNIFHPDSIKEKLNVPPVVLTSFKIFNKEVKLDTVILLKEEIELSYKDNFFTFEFSALDYTNPLKNQYKYMLEGIDRDWVTTTASQREAVYTDIEPGKYVFRVKGSNNNGIWNTDGASVRILIYPPWYTTWWFRGCGIILLLAFLVYERHKKTLKHKKEKQVQVEFTKQLIDSQEAERKRIAGELHDSLAQNLIIIKNKGLQIKKKPGQESGLLDDILEISTSTLQEVREISYNLHPYQLEKLGLTKAIKSMADKVINSSECNLKIDLDKIDNKLDPESEIIIYRIIQECLNNVIKHSEATDVNLSINTDLENIELNVSDNGIGFDSGKFKSDSTKQGLGLVDISERAKLLGGNFVFESEPGKGTVYKIIIPLRNHQT